MQCQWTLTALSRQSAVWLAKINGGVQLEDRNEEIPGGFFDAYVEEVGTT
ncbi:hypothetical protein [Pseudomonas sp. 2848]|nr:hypothetical protein [Pseudomonas sp. 2848]